MRMLILCGSLLLSPAVASAQGMMAWLDTTSVIESGQERYVTAEGWAVTDGHIQRNTPRAAFYIDDRSWVAWGPAYSYARPDVCRAFDANAWGWLCSAVRSFYGDDEGADWWGRAPSNPNLVGLRTPGIRIDHLPKGRHFIRLWLWTTPAYPQEGVLQPSNAKWFDVN